MEWINEIPKLNLKQKKYSQYGEEIIIDFIFKNINTKNMFFVDIGAGGAGRNLSNTKALIEAGWKGLRFDADGRDESVINVFIKPENIIETLKWQNCRTGFDFLSIDIDSFDYDVLDKVLPEYFPRVVCAEFNGTLDPLSCVKLKYEEGYMWDETNKYGFSFGAGLYLFKKHGYTVIFNHVNTNIFAIRNDCLPENFTIEVKAEQVLYHAVNKNAIFENVEPIIIKNMETNLLEGEHVIMPFQDKPFNGDGYMCEKFLQLRDQFDIGIAIELGSAVGGTARWLCQHFERVVTIELNKGYFDVCKQRVKGFENIECLYGNTLFHLPQVLEVAKKYKTNIIFHIDSHWAGNNPLIEELDIIYKSGLKPVLEIHDFKVPERPDLGFDVYGKIVYEWAWIEESINKIYGPDGYIVEYNSEAEGAKRGAIYIYSK